MVHQALALFCPWLVMAKVATKSSLPSSLAFLNNIILVLDLRYLETVGHFYFLDQG